MQLLAGGVTGKAAMRAGSLALKLLAARLNVLILEALATKPGSLSSLRQGGSLPSATTKRKHLAALARAGAVEQSGVDSAGAPVFRLTPAGHGLLGVAAVLRDWLAIAPAGALKLGTAEGSRATTALVDGWSTGIARILAARSRGLSELNRIVRSVSSAALAEYVEAMCELGLIEPVPEPAEETAPRYRPTLWLRRAIAPLAAAARWERDTGLEEAGPISRLEVEAAFLLTMPLVRLQSHLNGTCRLAVDLPVGGGRPAGALVGVKKGHIVSCITTIQQPAEGWVSGSPAAWLDAVINGETEGLEMGVNDHLAQVLLNALHQALFRPVTD